MSIMQYRVHLLSVKYEVYMPAAVKAAIMLNSITLYSLMRNNAKIKKSVIQRSKGFTNRYMFRKTLKSPHQLFSSNNINI